LWLHCCWVWRAALGGAADAAAHRHHLARIIGTDRCV